MNTTKKSLQKLTDKKNESGVSLSRAEAILNLEKITKDDLRGLSDSEFQEMFDIIAKRTNSLTGLASDEFWDKIDWFVGDIGRNSRWESNHITITGAISRLMQKYDRMPSTQEISFETKLSRQSVHKHISEYSNNPLYIEQIDQFRFLASRVLSTVYRFAVQGDLKACKLYLDTVGVMDNNNANNTLIQTQNNYIQINGITLSQDQVKKLNPEQLSTIESILKTALPADKLCFSPQQIHSHRND